MKFSYAIFFICTAIFLSCKEKSDFSSEQESRIKNGIEKVIEKRGIDSIKYEELKSLNSPSSGSWEGIYEDANNKTVRLSLELVNRQNYLSGKFKAWLPTEDHPGPIYNGFFTGYVHGDTLTFIISDPKDSLRKVSGEGTWHFENGAAGPSQAMFGFLRMPENSELIGGTWMVHLSNIRKDQ